LTSPAPAPDRLDEASAGASVFKPNVKPASRAELAHAYVTDVARSLGRMVLKHRRRTSDVVDAEYNSGTWGRVLAARSWLRAPSLRDFLVDTSETKLLAKVDGQIVGLAARDYYRYRIGALNELVARQAGPADSLLELGAGFGYNLFSLSLDPRWRKLRGLDISLNGIEAGRQIAGHFQLSDRISFGRIDLTDSQDPGFGDLAGSTVFTYFCLEQIPHSIELVIDHILRARPARVINIEPGVHMLRLTQPRDLASRIYIKSMDYQTRLFKLLDMLDARGAIRILARERMGFAPTLHNDGQLCVWEPRS
jgi:hypothetical protein